MKEYNRPMALPALRWYGLGVLSQPIEDFLVKYTVLFYLSLRKPAYKVVSRLNIVSRIKNKFLQINIKGLTRIGPVLPD